MTPLFLHVQAGLSGFFSIIRGIFVALGSLFGGGLVDTVKTALQRLSSGILQTTVYLLKFGDWLARGVGFKTTMAADFVKGVTRALAPEGKGGSVGMAAPLNTQIGSLQSLSNAITKSAFAMVPGKTKDEKEEAWRKDVVALLKKIAGEGKPVDKPVKPPEYKPSSSAATGINPVTGNPRSGIVLEY